MFLLPIITDPNPVDAGGPIGSINGEWSGPVCYGLHLFTQGVKAGDL